MHTRATLTALAGFAIAAPAAFGQRGDDNGPVDRCESTSCFNQLQIRRAEVIGETSLIVYVGGQECPFLVEFNGTFCDLTFLPTQSLVFRPSRLGRERAVAVVGGRGTAPDGGRAIEQSRICASDINMGIEANPFTSAVGGVDGVDDNGPSGLACRIQTVRSLTDDERLQIYVDNEMAAPPPPFGTGRIETPEDPQEPEARPAEDEDESRARRRRRDRDQDQD